MDSTSEVEKLLALELQILQNKIRHCLTSNNVTSCSDNDDDEKPLSHAEESAIEECLNDTESSLSNVDLNIFDDISDDLHVHRTRKTRGQRTSERMNMDFGGNGTDYDSSLDETEAFRTSSLAETSLDNPISMNSKTGKIRSQTEADQIIKFRKQLIPQERDLKIDKRFEVYRSENLKSSRLNKRIVRRKRRNSPPTKKNDKTHIHSFFSAMADLVSCFPEDHIAKAKQNVNIILEEMVDKLKELFSDGRPTNPIVFNQFHYKSIKLKLEKLQDLH